MAMAGFHGFIATPSDSLTIATTRVAAPSKIAAIKKATAPLTKVSARYDP